MNEEFTGDPGDENDAQERAEPSGEPVEEEPVFIPTEWENEGGALPPIQDVPASVIPDPETGMLGIRSVATPILFAEQMLAGAYPAMQEHPGKTLFLGLNEVDLSLVQLGLTIVATLYGHDLVAPLMGRMHESIEAQEFCDCANCKARREEGGEDNES